MRRLSMGVGMVAALALLGWGVLSVDRCPTGGASAPELLHFAQGHGALRVGAAATPISPPYPVTVAGYGPFRTSARSTRLPLMARAVIIDVGGQNFAWVQLDALLVTQPMRRALQRAAAMPVWLTATHTHSSMGGYDTRLAAQVAALGRYAQADEGALTAAANSALAQAKAKLEPATLEVSGTLETRGLTVARSGDEADVRLTRLRFVGARGPLAQWLILSAHPTLVEPREEVLDPDWPGRLAAREELSSGPVTLVLQGNGGNATVNRDEHPTPEDFAGAISEQLASLSAEPAVEPISMDWVEVRTRSPRPDASRLVPAVLRPAVENVLCDDAESALTVSRLRLGPVSLVALPLEPSAAAGRALEEAGRATRVVSLTNGYVGYVEPEGVVQQQEGESRRQYFGPELLGRLSDAVKLAVQHQKPPSHSHPLDSR